MSAIVYWHGSESMPEVADGTVKLLVCGGLYLGKDAGWPAYETVYRRNFANNSRIMRPDGWLCNIMTDQYRDNHCILRTARTTAMFESFGWRCVDVKVWQRKQLDFYQSPFTHITIMVPPGATHGRRSIKNRQYLNGVWNFNCLAPGKLNGFPEPLCRLLVGAFTEPGDLVVDPLAGTAMLLGVAARMGRRAVGYEIDRTLEDTVYANIGRPAGVLPKPGRLL